MRTASLSALAAITLFIAGCTAGGDPASTDEGAPPGSPRVEISVAPLSLTGVADAAFRLRVENASGQPVWERMITSGAFGDAAGSVSYVGPCDASPGETQNVVTIEVLGLYSQTAPAGEIPAASYRNPGPVARAFTCVPNGDTEVTFDLTIARRAEQGFFDVAVSFSNVFCSAKLDCGATVDPADDLLLLHRPDGTRGPTAVLGLACAGGDGQPPHLYLDALRVRCAGEGTDRAVIDPTGPGAVDLTVPPSANAAGYLFGAAVYRGTSHGGAVGYWNVALGLGALPAASCTLTTRATASQTALDGGAPPADAVWPVIDWSVELSSAGARTCVAHEVDDGGGVGTAYATPDAPAAAFGFHLSAATGAVNPVGGGAPMCDAGTVSPTSGDPAGNPEVLVVVDHALWARDGEDAVDDATTGFALAGGYVANLSAQEQTQYGTGSPALDPSLAGLVVWRGGVPPGLIYHECDEPDPLAGIARFLPGEPNHDECCIDAVGAGCPGAGDVVCPEQYTAGSLDAWARDPGCWDTFVSGGPMGGGPTGSRWRWRVSLFSATPLSTAADRVDDRLLLASFQRYVATHRPALETAIGGGFDAPILLSGVAFPGGVSNTTLVDTMCRGGVAAGGVQAYLPNTAGATRADRIGSTTARMLAFTLGVRVDGSGNNAACPSTGHIMAVAGSAPPTTWSSCSVDNLHGWLTGGYLSGPGCLDDPGPPRPARACGDGLLEGPEQCDPGVGVLDGCCLQDSCCLAAGCACANTELCCVGGALAGQAVSCRASTGTCDPAESCDGVSAGCPADAVAANADTCTVDGYGGGCYEGTCTSQEALCQAEFGTPASPFFATGCTQRGCCTDSACSTQQAFLLPTTDGLPCAGGYCEGGACQPGP